MYTIIMTCKIFLKIRLQITMKAKINIEIGDFVIWEAAKTTAGYRKLNILNYV